MKQSLLLVIIFFSVVLKTNPLAPNQYCDDGGVLENDEPCEDQYQCPAWATLGECTKNPTYMLTCCKRSCKACKGRGSTNYDLKSLYGKRCPKKFEHYGKSRTTALLLCIFLSTFGAGYFYYGYTGLGFLKLTLELGVCFVVPSGVGTSLIPSISKALMSSITCFIHCGLFAWRIVIIAKIANGSLGPVDTCYY